VITRAERVHWRLTWHQRLVRNARSSTASPVTLTLYSLPLTFAHRSGFALLDITGPLTIGRAALIDISLFKRFPPSRCASRGRGYHVNLQDAQVAWQR
jgi:hypothetical protein